MRISQLVLDFADIGFAKIANPCYKETA